MTCRNPVRVCVIYEFQVLTNQLIHHFERQLKFKIQNLKLGVDNSFLMTDTFLVNRLK